MKNISYAEVSFHHFSPWDWKWGGDHQALSCKHNHSLKNKQTNKQQRQQNSQADFLKETGVINKVILENVGLNTRSIKVSDPLGRISRCNVIFLINLLSHNYIFIILMGANYVILSFIVYDIYIRVLSWQGVDLSQD